MCEILLRVTDKIGSDPILDSKCTKRGDVIVVRPDGWGWGSEELSAPYWRILLLPNATEEDVASFLVPEPETDPQNPSPVRQRRNYKLDVDNLPGQWAAWIADDTRAEPTRTASFTGAQILAYRVKRPALPNPLEL